MDSTNRPPKEPPSRVTGGPGSVTERKRAGFTLLEMIIVISVIAILASIAVPRAAAFLSLMRRNKVMQDIKTIAYEVDLYKQMYGELPLELPQPRMDPWGNPYQYLNFDTIKGMGKGQMRKNKFLVPINSDYDLYSMGPDGKSQMPLTAKASRDDIIRANDGQYFGPASEY